MKMVTGAMQPQAKEIQGCRVATKSWKMQEADSCNSLQREHGPSGTSISDFCLPDCETTNLCYFSPSSLSLLVIETLTETTHLDVVFFICTTLCICREYGKCGVIYFRSFFVFVFYFLSAPYSLLSPRNSVIKCKTFTAFDNILNLRFVSLFFPTLFLSIFIFSTTYFMNY